MGSNKVLPLIVGVVLLMLLFVGLKSCSSDNPDNSQLSQVPIPGVPDADSPSDTIRTLTAEVAALKSMTSKQSQQNEALLLQKEDIEKQVKSQIMAQIKQEKAENSDSTMGGFTQQLSFLKTRMEELTQSQNQGKSSLSDIPVGFGLSGEGIAVNSPDEIVWVEPLGTEVSDDGTFSYPSQATSNEGILNKESNSITEQYLQGSHLEKKKDRPVYTVPRNSTLLGSTGMTALIGRIPRNGTVEDPFPFKVIVGKDNLAANGIQMPGLDGMIFSGKSTGDWTLSCVRGELQSVTYMFADGTVRTMSSDDKKNIDTKGQSSGQSDKSLGWISDKRGIPCVTGVRISNSASYLSGRVLASIAEGAAEAFSQNEVTNSVSSLGGVSTSVVTGDSAKFAAGNALAGGVSELSDYLRERMAQSFDVVYVDTGVELAVHIDVELPIDYEYNGRKTSYVSNEDDEYSRLD